mgnify:CR=1 FL=1
MQCPSCNGVGCKGCVNGSIQITQCPNRVIDEMHGHVELIDYMEDGMPPCRGGALDQTRWFLRACRFFKYEVRRAKDDG